MKIVTLFVNLRHLILETTFSQDKNGHNCNMLPNILIYLFYVLIYAFIKLKIVIGKTECGTA